MTNQIPLMTYQNRNILSLSRAGVIADALHTRMRPLDSKRRSLSEMKCVCYNDVRGLTACESIFLEAAVKNQRYLTLLTSSSPLRASPFCHTLFTDENLKRYLPFHTAKQLPFLKAAQGGKA